MKIKILILAVLMAVITGCSTVDKVKDRVVVKVGSDLTRTSEMANDYNKPAVKKCADWMLTRVKTIQDSNDALEKLRNEPTDGLLSSALKLALISEYVKSLQDANGPVVKAEFKAACSEVAGDMLFNIVQDAAMIGKRLN